MAMNRVVRQPVVMLSNIPNLLTLIRILLIPVMVVFFYLPTGWSRPVAAAIFVLAALTDLLDGFLARRLQQVSSLGAFLDPVADKLMVAAALILLVQADPAFWVAIPAIVIIGREIAISALREWMAELGARAQVAVSRIGKIKTFSQMTAIALMLYSEDWLGLPIYWIGKLLLYMAVILTLWSMTVYLQAAWPRLMGRDPVA